MLPLLDLLRVPLSVRILTTFGISIPLLKVKKKKQKQRISGLMIHFKAQVILKHLDDDLNLELFLINEKHSNS